MKENRNAKMNYEKMSRAMRYHYGNESRKGVNFTNILRTAFTPNFLRQKKHKVVHQVQKAVSITFLQKKLFLKCW
jgi:hypothetical protein